MILTGRFQPKPKTRMLKYVNLMWLTMLSKLDIKILRSLQNTRATSKLSDIYFRPEGNDTAGIAEAVWEKHMSDSAKTSLSRSLKKLYEKGLVKKGVPIYSYGWRKRDKDIPDSTGIWGRIDKDSYLLTTEILPGGYVNKERLPFVVEEGEPNFWGQRNRRYMELPYGMKKWWMLTSKGKYCIDHTDKCG